MEGNLRFKIDWAGLILGRKFSVFLCFTLYLRAISNFPEGFLRYESGGLISRGAYTWRGLFSEFYCVFSVPQTYIRENSFLPHYL